MVSLEDKYSLSTNCVPMTVSHWRNNSTKQMTPASGRVGEVTCAQGHNTWQMLSECDFLSFPAYKLT